MVWLLEVVLVGLLAATLFHAVRLERALGVLKRDRTALQELVDSFNTSTRQAEAGVERLRSAAEGIGLQLARQVEAAIALKDDLNLLVERGDRLADRLDAQIRAGRPIAVDQRPVMVPDPANNEPRVRSQAERDLLKALRIVR